MKRIKFIRVKHGDQIDFGDTGLFGVSGTTKYLGFKPGHGQRAEGWLVFAVGKPQWEPVKKKASQ